MTGDADFEPALAVLSERIGDTFERSALPVLADYTRIACLSPAFDADWEMAGELRRAAELLTSYIAATIPSAQVDVIALPGRTPVILAELAASDPARAGSTTLIYGHFDKQPPLGEWRAGLDAFTPVREGDRLYGRGTADDGYATFAASLALAALDAAGKSHGRVVLLIEASEESGSPDLPAYLDHLAERIGTPGLVICLDSGCITYDRLWVTSSLRGNLVATVRVDVLDEGVHSGLAGDIVPSSFRICRQLLARLEDARTGEILVAELNSEIPEHRRRELEEVAAEFGAEAVGAFPIVEGLELTGVSVAEQLLNGTWRPSLSVTGAGGLPSLRDGGNVQRPYTALKLSLRFPPNVDATVAAAALERLLCADPPARARVTVEFEAPAAGWDAPEPAPWLSAAVEEASVGLFGASHRGLGLGGSIPFLAMLGSRFPGTQFLATGVLGPESNAHGPNEFLHIPTAKAVSAAVAHVLTLAP